MSPRYGMNVTEVSLDDALAGLVPTRMDMVGPAIRSEVKMIVDAVTDLSVVSVDFSHAWKNRRAPRVHATFRFAVGSATVSFSSPEDLDPVFEEDVLSFGDVRGARSIVDHDHLAAVTSYITSQFEPVNEAAREAARSLAATPGFRAGLRSSFTDLVRNRLGDMLGPYVGLVDHSTMHVLLDELYVRGVIDS